MYKVLGVLMMVAAGTFAFMVFRDDTKHTSATCVQLTPAQQFSNMINDDFQRLRDAKQLPLEWAQIGTVEIRMNSVLAKTLLGQERPNIQRVKDGGYFLELEIVDLPDEENPGVIVQASLFEIKSKNKIFEIGRTYTMNELNQVSTAETPETVSE